MRRLQSIGMLLSNLHRLPAAIIGHQTPVRAAACRNKQSEFAVASSVL
jgi:hypothetical protein